MYYLVDMYKHKVHFLEKVSDKDYEKISLVRKNIEECLSYYEYGLGVRDALDDLYIWTTTTFPLDQNVMRHLHKAERLCRMFLFEFRTCLDYFETTIKRKYGTESDLWKIFKGATHNAYDSSQEYAFTYQLRNCAQHCSQIVHGFNGDSSHASSNAETLLKNFTKWKESEKEYISSWKDNIDLVFTFNKAFEALNTICISVMKYFLNKDNVAEDILWLYQYGKALEAKYEHPIDSYCIYDIRTKTGKSISREEMESSKNDSIIYSDPFDWDVISEVALSIKIRNEDN